MFTASIQIDNVHAQYLSREVINTVKMYLNKLMVFTTGFFSKLHLLYTLIQLITLLKLMFGMPTIHQSQWPRSLGCWDRGFKSHSGHVCLSVVLSCVDRGLCNGLITHPEQFYHVSNCMCDHRNPKRGPMFQLGTTGKWMNDAYNSHSENGYLFYSRYCYCSPYHCC
jgi:hypothetical protein